MTIAKNTGSVVAHTRHAGFIEGRARSDRRVMRGPELGVGAAMRVRLFDGLRGMTYLERGKALCSLEGRRREGRRW